MEFLLGTAKVQLKSLASWASRDKIPAAVSHLALVLKNNCQSTALQNQIPVYVWSSELYQLLEESGISLAAFSSYQTADPLLKTSIQLRGLHGRQRYEAALREFGPDAWWTIRLFCLPDGSNPETLLRHEVEQYSFQTPCSDGEVFRKVWGAKLDNNRKVEREWMLRLSKSKQKAMRRLCNEGTIARQLYKLMQWPGLREGLELGNIQRDFALHCREEIKHCLENIEQFYLQITLNNSEVQQATDPETVESLQLLVPAASHTDHQDIRVLMRSGKLFSKITCNHLRGMIEGELLKYYGVIPSIKTFHENMKYLGVGMTVIRDHLIGPTSPSKTVFRAMGEIWQPGPNLIEYADGHFYEISCPSSMSLAYQQVFISALRDFPELSDFKPIYEQGCKQVEAGVRSACLKRFLKRAMALGFKSEDIELKLERMNQIEEEEESLDEESHHPQEVVKKRRCGRPLLSSFRYTKKHLFLPDLLDDHGVAVSPRTLVIQEDFFRSFFGGFPDDATANMILMGRHEMPGAIIHRIAAPYGAGAQQEQNSLAPVICNDERIRNEDRQLNDTPRRQSMLPDNSVVLSLPALSAAISALNNRRRVPMRESDQHYRFRRHGSAPPTA